MFGAAIDHHHKGIIAGAALSLSLMGDAILTKMHLKTRA